MTASCMHVTHPWVRTKITGNRTTNIKCANKVYNNMLKVGVFAYAILCGNIFLDHRRGG